MTLYIYQTMSKKNKPPCKTCNGTGIVSVIHAPSIIPAQTKTGHFVVGIHGKATSFEPCDDCKGTGFEATQDDKAETT